MWRKNNAATPVEFPRRPPTPLGFPCTMDRQHRASIALERIRIAQDALTKVTLCQGITHKGKRLKTADKNQRAAYRLPQARRMRKALSIKARSPETLINKKSPEGLKV